MYRRTATRFTAYEEDYSGVALPAQVELATHCSLGVLFQLLDAYLASSAHHPLRKLRSSRHKMGLG